MNNTLIVALIGLVVLGIGGYIFMGNSNTNTEEKLCAQVITPARNLATGEIKEFPTPCDVPEGWETVASANIVLDEGAAPLPSVLPPPPLQNTSTNTKTQSVAYTAEGFSPKSITVTQGTTVTFTNASVNRMWVGAAMHPTHEAYDGTTTKEHCANGVATNGTFDQCHAVEMDGSWSYTFNKVGSWNYHNHSRASDFGTVIVTP